MARIVRQLWGKSRRTAGLGAVTLAGLGVLGVAAGPAGAATTTSYTASATASGLAITLFGTSITGGKATVSVDSATPQATAQGTGELTPGLVGEAKASASGDNSSHSTPQTCSPVAGATPSSSPVTVALQVACGSASAAVDGSGNPSGSASGRISGLQVNASSLLNQVIQGGGNQLTAGVDQVLSQVDGSPLGSTPLGQLTQGVKQAVSNLQSVVQKTSAPDTLDVGVGPASASITSSTGSATATAEGETLDVQILPGVGEIGPDLTGGTPAPLVEIKIAPATATSTFNGSSWTSTSHGSLATISLNIPGFNQTIDVAPGQSQEILAGTPLASVIDLGSATTSGGTATANGATLDLLKGVQGGILLDLGSTTTSGSVATPGPAVAAASSPAPASPAPAVAAASPTAVHTGEWWAGSLPLVGLLLAAGSGLLAWPRIRRIPLAARLLHRAHR